MIAIHSAAINIMVDCKTLKIVILINLTKKILKVIKRVRLSTIHECIDVVYIITDMFKVFIVLTTIAATASVIELLISV